MRINGKGFFKDFDNWLSKAIHTIEREESDKRDVTREKRRGGFRYTKKDYN